MDRLNSDLIELLYLYLFYENIREVNTEIKNLFKNHYEDPTEAPYLKKNFRNIEYNMKAKIVDYKCIGCDYWFGNPSETYEDYIMYGLKKLQPPKYCDVCVAGFAI